MKEESVDEIVIGSFDPNHGMEIFINELKVTSDKDDRFPFTVTVRGREGAIPHCHVFTNSGKKVCVCLHTNNYFNHNDEWSQNFSNNEKKDFNTWVRAKYLSPEELANQKEQRKKENEELLKIKKEDPKKYKEMKQELVKKRKEEDEKEASNVKDSNWYHMVTTWEEKNPDCLFPDYKKLKNPPDYKNIFNYYNKK